MKLLENFPEHARVAFQGALGAYSEMAIRTCLDGYSPVVVPMREFEDVFEALKTNKVSFGMLPIENALTGTIHQVMDLIFANPDLEIVAEYRLRISHNLIVHPLANLDSIQEVLSHTQGLQQCKQYLDNFPHWKKTIFFDTAGSVELIAQTGDTKKAAIASKLAASTYKMKILAESIETNQRNYTRFALIRTKSSKGSFEKCGKQQKHTIIYGLRDKPGALVSSLKIFEAQHFNLSKIESRPIHGKPFEYLFYIEMKETEDTCSIEKLVEELKTVATEIRLIGSYPAFGDV